MYQGTWYMYIDKDCRIYVHCNGAVHMVRYNGIVATTYKTLKPANHEHYASYL